jgi:hypothetical protein
VLLAVLLWERPVLTLVRFLLLVLVLVLLQA